jgi:hypothetical protein
MKTMSREEPFHRINEPVTKGKSCAADKNCKEGNASLADSTEDTTGEKSAHWALGTEIKMGNYTRSRHQTPDDATTKPKHERRIESPGGNQSNSEAVQTAVRAPEAHTYSGRRKSQAEKKKMTGGQNTCTWISLSGNSCWCASAAEIQRRRPSNQRNVRQS